MNKLNIPKEQLISNSDMTKFVEDVLSDFYKDKDLVEFALLETDFVFVDAAFNTCSL